MSMDHNEIAIIGMSGRYPGASTPGELWENIVAGRDLAEVAGASAPPGIVRRDYALDGVDQFDHDFFGYTPNEARMMDPQHRLLLTHAFRALEDAGCECVPEHVRVGVYATSSFSSYLHNVVLPHLQQTSGEIHYGLLIGNDSSFAATKISYKLDLKGPSMNIQCGCSSSMVALHYACQGLLNGDCDLALVCGVSVRFPQRQGYLYREGGPLSPDGVCRPFDRAANGTVPGAACTVVVLERLVDAERNYDRVYAVVSGTAVNNDGAEKVGFTAPSISGQRAVIAEAMAFADKGPADIDYVEAHGTGTVLGDQIELAGLSEAFATRTSPLPVGSIKSNLGHADVAAGITSVVKGVLMLRAGTIPPIANLRQSSADAAGPGRRQFDFPTSPRTVQLRNLGVSSFGIGGTNAHAILSAYTGQPTQPRVQLPWYLIPLHLNHLGDLPRYRQTLREALGRGTNVLDLAATLAVGRRRRAVTLSFVARDREDFLCQLEKITGLETTANNPLPTIGLDDLQEFEATLPSFALYARDHAGAGTAALLHGYLTHLKVGMLVTGDGPLSTSGGGGESLRRLFELLARAATASVVDLAALYAGTHWRRISLPAYPLNQKRHWYGPADEQQHAQVPAGTAPIAAVACSSEEVLTGVLRIWANATGHEEVTPDTTYAETGADSLVAMDILTELQKAYCIRLPATELLTQLTPGSIARRIVGADMGGESSSCLSTVRRASRPDAPTVFLIHPAGGSTFCYSAMNRFLSGDFNVCVLDLPDDHARHGTLEQLAAHYLELIRRHLPQGPYCLCGYSFGGNVAYEIAAQMERRGLAVEQVVMFDSHPPEAYQEPDMGEIDYEPICSKVLLEFLDFGPLLSRSDPLDIKNFCRRWSHCFRLLKAHRPTHTVAADLVLFAGKKAERQDVMAELNMRHVDKAAWRRYFRGDVRIVPVSGDHYSMFGVSMHLRRLARAFESLFVPPVTRPVGQEQGAESPLSDSPLFQGGSTT